MKILNTKKYEKQKAKKKANLKSSKILLSVFFDDKIVFFDLEKEMKDNMKIKEKKKNEKFVIIGVIQSADKYSYAYVFKLSKDIYKRFENSISSNGNSIKKSGLFDANHSGEEDNTDNQLKLDDLINEANDADKNKKHSSNRNKIIGFEDSENDSEKDTSKKKSDQGSINQGILKPRGDKKQLTFGANMFNLKKDNLNESDEKDNDEDKSDKEVSSADLNSSDLEEKKSEEDEDDEKEDSEEKEGSESDEEEEDDEDSNKEDNSDNNEENNESENNLEKSDDNKPKEKNQDINEKKEDKDSNENKDVTYSDKSKNNEEDSEAFLRNNDKKEEEINTDIKNIKIDKKDNLESKLLSEKEDEKSDSSG